MENENIDYNINKELAECYFNMQDLDQAEEYYRKAITCSPSSAAPYMGLATIAFSRGELDNAITLYKKAMSLEDDGKARCGMGLVFFQQGKLEEAFAALSQALEKIPGNLVALNGIVRVAYMLQRVEDIIPALEAAIDDCTQPEAVHVTLAGCLMYLGRNEEARKHLEIVLNMNPANTSAKEMFDNVAA